MDLQIGNTQITSLSPSVETVDGLFQALAIWGGGFYVVPIPSLRISLQCEFSTASFQSLSLWRN